MKHFANWNKEDYEIFREGVTTAVMMMLEEKWSYFESVFNRRIRSKKDLEKCVEKMKKESARLAKKVMENH